MSINTTVFIILSWQEEGRSEAEPDRVLYPKERKIFKLDDYPNRLPCGNLNCEHGGYNIGDKITDLVASGKNEEQNSLICGNAVQPDHSKRCLHTIRYSITCVYPFRRGAAKSPFSQLQLEPQGQL